MVVVDRTGMVHNNLELRERGGPSSQSTSAFRRRPPGKRQAVKPSSRQAGEQAATADHSTWINSASFAGE